MTLADSSTMAGNRDQTPARTPYLPLQLPKRPAAEPRTASSAEEATWCLRARLAGGRSLVVPIAEFPFRIGRSADSDLAIPSEWASSRHAEIRGDSDALTLVDLNSTNGTFLNGSPVQTERPMCAGDVIHIGDFELEVSRESRASLPRSTVQLTHQQLPSRVEATGRALRRLIEERAVAVDFQPIVDLRTEEVAAVEALGRGTHPELPTEPASLFEVAAGLRLEVDLSRAFRQETLHSLMALVARSPPPVFLNVHPVELTCPELTEMLVSLRQSAPGLDLVVELPEEFLDQTSGLLEIRAILTRLGVRMAYDDFGVGKARLAELAEAPPDFLKFGVAFIRDIDTAAPSKRRLLSALVSATRDLGATAIATGVETQAERDVCLEAGFDQAQGGFFGAPTPHGCVAASPFSEREARPASGSTRFPSGTPPTGRSLR